MFNLSPDQIAVRDTLMSWITTTLATQTTQAQTPDPASALNDPPFITLGGYAGTGKTTLIALIRKELATIHPDLKIGFASYTGKATRVLRSKLTTEQALLPQDTVSTIHALMYSPIINDTEEIIGWKRKDGLDRQLIIIDEGSMVDGQIWRHLLSYNIPIIAVGDHGQLPPIKGSFNLMQEPQLRLEQIHRQAHMHPIISLSIQARENGLIRTATYSDTVGKYDLRDIDTQERVEELLNSYDSDTLILCGYNTTRVRLNNHIRSLKGIDSPEPIGGDRVICLRNNHTKKIYNGMLGTITSIERVDDDWYNATIELDDEPFPFTGLISRTQFGNTEALNFTDKRSRIQTGDLFDFGYAMTVHKAQGSQAKRVVLFEERFAKMTEDEWRKWLYTAITRAEEELYVFAR